MTTRNTLRAATIAISGILAAYTPSAADAANSQDKACHLKEQPLKIFKNVSDMSYPEISTLESFLDGSATTIDLAGSEVRFRNTLRRGDKKSWGNGVYLGNGLILTAGHLVGVFANQKGADGILIPGVEEPLQYRIIVKSNKEDLALIRVKEKQRHLLANDPGLRVKLYGGELSRGDSLVHITTNPDRRGEDMTGLKGTYEGCEHEIIFKLAGGKKLKRVNQNYSGTPERIIISGDSGSGVYCITQGGSPALCGIVTGVSQDGSRATFTDHESIRSMIERYIGPKK